MTLFEVTDRDVADLDDADLRTLVARLCEEALRGEGLPTSAVTWGGNQDAKDGGIDVRVELPPATPITGYVPRAATGMQVKKPRMRPADILDEMRPDGVLRPVIQELASTGGAYVLVSSTDSVSDSALKGRRKAMREAVAGAPGADGLLLDFYDGRRLASWVRNHPGLVAWVREKVGRPLRGWRPHGPWTSVPAGQTDDYLADAQVRLRVGAAGGPGEDDRGCTALEGVGRLRASLRVPGTSIRLVGLSGTGKTRLLQALFEAGVDEGALDPAHALYADVADAPEPPPVALATRLLQERTRAVLVIDNCPPDLHRQLTQLVRGSGSNLSLITVEYDIRDDQPEGTDVFRLEAASTDLVRRLVERRFPAVSRVDAGTIAEFSEGNARVAFALANTLERGGTLAGLSDEQLILRLLQQRHGEDKGLLAAAGACALVYSFDGEDTADRTSELARLAALAGTTALGLHRAVAELRRRDLVQARRVWRALLPQAIANRLAKRALEDIPVAHIERELSRGGDRRLLRSFSRRLGHLHDSPVAVRTAERWLSPPGFSPASACSPELPHAAALNEDLWEILTNIAPLSPAGALRVFERVPEGEAAAGFFSGKHRHRGRAARLLRKLAYDAGLFPRAVAVLVRLAAGEAPDERTDSAARVFASLFTPYLSGTHATVEQRSDTIKVLLAAEEPRHQDLGIKAIEVALQSGRFTSLYGFDFGALSRDHGHHPATAGEVRRWYTSFIGLATEVGTSASPVAPRVRDALATALPHLWWNTGFYDEIEEAVRRLSSGEAYWDQGWIAVRRALLMGQERGAPHGLARLWPLEQALAPRTLPERIAVFVLGAPPPSLEESSNGEGALRAYHEAEATAERLGRELAADASSRELVLPRVFVGDWGRCRPFARGLALACPDPDAIWEWLVSLSAEGGPSGNGVQVLGGYLAGMAERHPDRASAWLDKAVEHPALAPWFPHLQASVGFDAAGQARMLRSVEAGLAPAHAYGQLALGGASKAFPPAALGSLLEGMVTLSGGFDVAVDVLAMRFFGEGDASGPDPDLVAAGRALLQRFVPVRATHSLDHRLGIVASACLADAGGEKAATELGSKLRASLAKHATTLHEHEDLVRALLKAQPSAALDALMPSHAAIQTCVRPDVFDGFDDRCRNPLDELPADLVLAWCAADPGINHERTASCIRYAEPTGDGGDLAWTGLALALLDQAPEKAAVLQRFTGRFRPNAWTGSLAATIERRARLLLFLEEHSDAAVSRLAKSERERLLREADEARVWEARLDRERGGSFEP